MSDDQSMTPSFGDDFDVLEAELGRLAREATATDAVLETPPTDLWSAIAAEAFGEAAPARSNQAPLETSARRDSPFGGPEAPFDVPIMAEASRPSAPVTDLSERRNRRSLSPGLLAAAAALAVLMAVGGYLVAQVQSGAGTGELLATAKISNDELPVEFAESGSASVRRTGSDLYLELELPALPPTGDEAAYYEVWMIDTDVDRMISLGVADSNGRIDIPDGVDHTKFPVVDISVEPLDGDPTHSGQSILRGVLENSGT